MIHRSGRAVLFPAWMLLLAAATPSTLELRAQEPFPAWVGLYGEASLARLENENRLTEICVAAETMSECYREQLAPSITSVPLHSDPDPGSPVVGELMVAVVPGRGLSAFYRSEGSSLAPAPFAPDLFLSDWGYGPYFHQTIAERRDDWFMLPPGPWASPVWISVPGSAADDLVLSVHAGDIIDFEGLGWYVVSTARDHLLLRPEQAADMWCQEGEPPPVDEVLPTRFLRAELLDAENHLVIRPKYPKGC